MSPAYGIQLELGGGGISYCLRRPKRDQQSHGYCKGGETKCAHRVSPCAGKLHWGDYSDSPAIVKNKKESCFRLCRLQLFRRRHQESGGKYQVSAVVCDTDIFHPLKPTTIESKGIRRNARISQQMFCPPSPIHKISEKGLKSPKIRI